MKQESEDGVQSIDDGSWGSGPYTSLFYYHKAATYFELLQTKTTFNVFRDEVLKVGVSGTPFASRDEFLTAYKDSTGYVGSAGDNLTAGWWGGSYASSVFPTTLLNDADADGVYDFQETALGTNAANADSDGDRASDLFEKVMGLNPKVSQAVSYLATDNLLSDWTASLPGALHTELQSSNATAPCTDFARLIKYGVTLRDGWLLIAGELQRAPTTGEDLAISVFFNQGPEQIYVPYGTTTIWHANPTTRAVDALYPFTGKSFEIAYNTAWLGWTDGKAPAGMVFHVATFSGGTQCDLSATITP